MPRRFANSNARARVSKDEDGRGMALMLRDASQRIWAVEASAPAPRCDAPQHEGEGGAPTCGCTKSRLGQFPLFRIDINNGNCNSNVFGLRGPFTPICHPRCGTIRCVPPSVVMMCHHPSS